MILMWCWSQCFGLQGWKEILTIMNAWWENNFDPFKHIRETREPENLCKIFTTAIFSWIWLKISNNIKLLALTWNPKMAFSISTWWRTELGSILELHDFTFSLRKGGTKDEWEKKSNTELTVQEGRIILAIEIESWYCWWWWWWTTTTQTRTATEAKEAFEQEPPGILVLFLSKLCGKVNPFVAPFNLFVCLSLSSSSKVTCPTLMQLNHAWLEMTCSCILPLQWSYSIMEEMQPKLVRQ